MSAVLDRISWPLAVILALTLGLAPFFPVPHVVEKLRWLAAGDLTRPLDIADLAMHAAPWMLLAGKAAVALSRR